MEEAGCRRANASLYCSRRSSAIGRMAVTRPAVTESVIRSNEASSEAGEPGIVAEGGQRLLERVEGLVRDLHRGPVQRRALRGHPGREALEPHPGQRPADVELLLLAVLDAHRDGQHPDVAVPVPAADLAGHAGGALDALVAQREADHQDVRQVDRADVGHVAQPGPAVDQHVVVVLLHVVAHGAEEPPAAEPVVEVVPVERADRGGIVAVLAAGREEIQLAPVGERPVQRDGMPLDLREFQVPVIAAWPGSTAADA